MAGVVRKEVVRGEAGRRQSQGRAGEDPRATPRTTCFYYSGSYRPTSKAASSETPWHPPGAFLWDNYRESQAKGGPLFEATRRKLDLVALGWLNDVVSYVWDTGEQEDGRIERQMPRCGSGKAEFSAAYRDFYHARRPSRARLVNALSRFHATVAPIEVAEISP